MGGGMEVDTQGLSRKDDCTWRTSRLTEGFVPVPKTVFSGLGDKDRVPLLPGNYRKRFLKRTSFISGQLKL